MKLLNGYKYILILVLVAVVSHVQTFIPSTILSYSDWSYWNIVASRELFEAYGTWLGYLGLGAINIQIPFNVFNVIWSSFANIGISFAVYTKVTFLIPIAILGFLAPYFFARSLFKNDFIAFIAAIFYGTTTYFLLKQSAHLPIAFIYAITPLLLLVFNYAVARKQTAYWLIFVLLFSIGVGYEVRIMTLVSVLLALSAVFFVDFKSRIVRKFFVITAIILVLLNIYWLLPTLLGSLGSDALAIANRGLFGNFLFDIQHAFTITDFAWTGGLPNGNFVLQNVKLYAWIAPIVAFSSFFFISVFNKKEKKLLLYFGILSLIGIFLTKQSAEPFNGVYSWLYSSVPGFNLFREASKYFLVTSIGYLGLISLFLLGAYRTRKYLYYIGASLIIVLALINLKPLITTEMRTMFVSRQIPPDYITLEKFINKQPEYFRTYWLPTYSRWGIFSSQHPKVSGVELTQNGWNRVKEFDSSEPIQKQIVAVLKRPDAEQILSQASIKYIVVPLRDKANDDDFYIYYGNNRQYYINALNQTKFLKRLDIGTKDLAIYENINYKPHLDTQASIYKLDSIENLVAESSFLKQIGSNLNSFYVGVKNILGASSVTELFTTQKSTTEEVTVNSSQNTATLYKNTGRNNLYYRTSGNNVSLYTKPISNPALNGVLVQFPGSATETPIANVGLGSNTDPYMILDNQIIPLSGDKTVDLGNVQNYSLAAIYNLGANQIANGSFENGPWQVKVGDCNAFNKDSKLKMSISSDHTDGAKSLQLEATRHIACTSTKVNVSGGQEELFSFDYKSTNTKTAGYFIGFNDPAKTVIKDRLTISGTGWHTLLKNITVPPDATSALIFLYSYESDGVTNNVVLYDNVSLRSSEKLQNVILPKYPDNFISMPLTLGAGKNTLSQESAKFTGNNLIRNPSFEAGLWQEQVGDCNAFNTKVKLGMVLSNEAVDGKKSLQLEATKHIACTSTDIDVPSNGDYNFSFSYQSPNSKQGGYYLQFNDPAKTVVRANLPITSKEWQQFDTVIHAPAGATSATLALYAYETDGQTNNIVRYDNFSFKKISELGNTYYLVTNSNTKLAEPKKLSFGAVNPTKQIVQIAGATKPFLLSFAEGFNNGWKLYLRPIAKEQPCKAIKTIITPEPVTECASKPKFMMAEDLSFLTQKPIFDDQHVKLNGYANGWMVDPAYIKAHYSKEYYRENADGSLDLNMAIYFKPQSYFYIGVAISGITLIACVSYLGYAGVKSYNRRRRDKAKPEEVNDEK